jgi:hypothetical protein
MLILKGNKQPSSPPTIQLINQSANEPTNIFPNLLDSMATVISRTCQFLSRQHSTLMWLNAASTYEGMRGYPC